MKKQPTHAAQIPNPALNPFRKLVGEWKTVGTHPALPGKQLTGYSSFNWMEGGAFLIWHSEMDEEGFPNGIAIFGSDDATNKWFMLYFDERKVSRMYEVSLQNNVLSWWRDAPDFSQRYIWTFTDDDNTMISKGELSKNGTSWEADLEQVFTRVM
ncbi:DUF1579 domain-containing protein [Spirosoma sp. HMF4905]|uniref:DUF1579 domain-containing protein n=1 Tax=Spirosoma arboris TaxID=2682092 RepID=A0A7K1SHK4_9BACT|nr:DUF1579 domain-containing protein [Spirosoma arboris]MVM33299.1 DUF1579 domain-containing protein [Spirosoma arboris]